jgi:hypothetical protein
MSRLHFTTATVAADDNAVMMYRAKPKKFVRPRMPATSPDAQAASWKGQRYALSGSGEMITYGSE